MAAQARFLGCFGQSTISAATAAAAGALLIAMLVGMIGCSQSGGPTGEAPPPSTAATAQTAPVGEPTAAAGSVVIAQLLTHDAKVAIVGGGKDLRIDVRKLDGTLVAGGLTLAELRVQQPELYVVVTSASASSMTIDATLGPMN